MSTKKERMNKVFEDIQTMCDSIINEDIPLYEILNLVTD